MKISSWSRERLRARLALFVTVVGVVMGVHALAPGHARALLIDCTADPANTQCGGSGPSGGSGTTDTGDDPTAGDPTAGDPSTQVSYPDPTDPSTQVSYPDPTDPSTQVSYPDPTDPSTQVSYPDPSDPPPFPIHPADSPDVKFDAISGAGRLTNVCAGEDPASSRTPMGPAYAQAFDAYLQCRAALGHPLPQSVIDGITGLLNSCHAEEVAWMWARHQDGLGSPEEENAFSAYQSCSARNGLAVPQDPLANPLNQHRVAPPGGKSLIGPPPSAVQQANDAHAAMAAAEQQVRAATRAAMSAAIRARDQADNAAGLHRRARAEAPRKHHAKRGRW